MPALPKPTDASSTAAAVDAAVAPPVASTETADSLASVDPAWAWAPYQPSQSCPWNSTLAAHLYRRAAFGATGTELQRAVKLGAQATIDQLLDPPAEGSELSTSREANEAHAARSGDAQGFQAWWLRRLIESGNPLVEKLTLFWHNRFAIGAAATGDLPLFHSHLQTLRGNTLGDFRSLLGALLRDPAMFIALGGSQNRRAQPNLAFARPWLEVFTVGSRAAGAEDIEGVARAFTGCFVYGSQLRFIDREHDDGVWTVLGRRGQCGCAELLDLLASHPQTARNLVRGLFCWFISETALPTDALLQPLADAILLPGGVRTTVRTMLSSNLFFSRRAVGQKIKSPVELAVGLARGLEGTPPCLPLASDLGRLGQQLSEPPTARGWPTGSDWINTISLGARLQLGQDMLNGSREYGKGLDPWPTAEKQGCRTVAEATQFWLELLLQNQLPASSVRTLIEAAQRERPGSSAARRIVTSILCQPEFQLN